eukprot:Amastigsp_a676511_325.p2 type:complete len:163 gc:universal Amastigsp_a676511_325:710-222(-)
MLSSARRWCRPRSTSKQGSSRQTKAISRPRTRTSTRPSRASRGSWTRSRRPRQQWRRTRSSIFCSARSCSASRRRSTRSSTRTKSRSRSQARASRPCAPLPQRGLRARSSSSRQRPWRSSPSSSTIPSSTRISLPFRTRSSSRTSHDSSSRSRASSSPTWRS